MIRTTGIINTPIGAMKDQNIYAINRDALQLFDPAVNQSTAYQKTLLSYDPKMPVIKRGVDKPIRSGQLFKNSKQSKYIRKLGIQSKIGVENINAPTLGPQTQQPPSQPPGPKPQGPDNTDPEMKMNYEDLKPPTIKREPMIKEDGDLQLNYQEEKSLRSIMQDLFNQFKSDNEKLPKVSTVGPSTQKVDIGTNTFAESIPITKDQGTDAMSLVPGVKRSGDEINPRTKTRIKEKVEYRTIEKVVNENRMSQALLVALQNWSQRFRETVSRSDYDSLAENNNRAWQYYYKLQDINRGIINDKDIQISNLERDIDVIGQRNLNLTDLNVNLQNNLSENERLLGQRTRERDNAMEDLDEFRDYMVQRIYGFFPEGYLEATYGPANTINNLIADVRENGERRVLLTPWLERWIHHMRNNTRTTFTNNTHIPAMDEIMARTQTNEIDNGPTSEIQPIAGRRRSSAEISSPSESDQPPTSRTRVIPRLDPALRPARIETTNLTGPRGGALEAQGLTSSVRRRQAEPIQQLPIPSERRRSNRARNSANVLNNVARQ